jgi:hypothetical protein
MRKLTEADLDRAQAWREQPLPEQPPSVPGYRWLKSGRKVFDTGKVEIGSRYQPQPDYARPVPHSALWVQKALLDTPQPKEQRA